MLRAISMIPMLFAALVLRTDRKIVGHLRGAKAVSAGSAIPLDVPHFLGSWRLSRLAGAGAICQAQPQRYYLEEGGYAAYRKRRRRRFLVMLSILIPFLMIMWWLLNR